MGGLRFDANKGTLSGLVLLVVGAVLVSIFEFRTTGWTVGVGVLTLASVAYLLGRIGTILRSRRP